MRHVNEKSAEFRRYRTKVDQVINECSIVARNLFGWKADQWANAAGVSPTTVDNLLSRKTRFPFFHTLYRLAYAVGCELWVDDTEAAAKAPPKVVVKAKAKPKAKAKVRT